MNTLFVGGTSSNAGKSWMVTAICAWLRRHGVAVAPFKAQNMSNNAYPCADGREIGRAQAVQAEACGLAPETAMNPVLLKPSGNGTSQVVVNGAVWQTLGAREYYERCEELRAHVWSAYQDLARRFEFIVVEGAGSVSELNLRRHDLVNLPLVTRIGCPWMLVADIERGGVFASIVGTVELLTRDERTLLRGFAVNKFHGDRSLFDDGVRLLEERTGSACVGVFPYTAETSIDAEDSLALDTSGRQPPPSGARTAILHLPHIANATDFRRIPWAEWISHPAARDFDVVIVPGTKNTLMDLAWLRSQQLDRWVLAQHARGAKVVGICGGYQMLGRSIHDPDAAESSLGGAEGLGLLPVVTIMSRAKTARVVTATTGGGAPFGAYEIHLGRTTAVDGSGVAPFARLLDGSCDGARVDRVVGTYLHGALENRAVLAELLGVDLVEIPSKQQDYDRLADWFDRHCSGLAALDLERFRESA
jgi:adenosylcobyric acid synthase